MGKLPDIVTPSLDTLDALEVEDLVIGLFEDERPLRGVAGLVDWRLCGLLSRYLQQGRFSGRQDERVLTTGAARVPPTRLFLLGLGEREAYGKALRTLIESIPAMLKAAGCRKLALALPGPSRVLAPHVEAFTGALADRLVVLFDADGRLREWLERDRG